MLTAECRSDTFTGAYAAEYVRQKKRSSESFSFDIEAAVIRACKAGAICVGAIGSQTSMPWADEIESFMPVDVK